MNFDEFIALPPGTVLQVRASLLGPVGTHARNVDVSGHLLRVGSGDVELFASSAPRRVRFKATNTDEVWAVLAEHRGWLWIGRGGDPVMARCSWVEDIEGASS